MVNCSAVNCSNRSEKGFRLFKFSSDTIRRKKWVQNCRRDKWNPSNTARLCEVHFEDSQWEKNRADGWIKLKPNAIPTLFKVPNPPPKIDFQNESRDRDRAVKNKSKKTQLPVKEVEPIAASVEFELDQLFCDENNSEIKALRLAYNAQIEVLKQENNKLKSFMQEQIQKVQEDHHQLLKEKLYLENEITNRESILKDFLTKDQLSSLQKDKMKEWDHETIIKALKMGFHLRINGHEFLRSTHYPLPSPKTLSNRFRTFQVTTGILEDLNELITYKMRFMEPLDQYV